jgi:dTDP-4-amino-4,6-dideoxygalactose transaminase
MPVHYAGVAPTWRRSSTSRRRALRVVEDAAQGIAARWRGRALGTLGDAAA